MFDWSSDATPPPRTKRPEPHQCAVCGDRTDLARWVRNPDGARPVMRWLCPRHEFPVPDDAF